MFRNHDAGAPRRRLRRGVQTGAVVRRRAHRQPRRVRAGASVVAVHVRAPVWPPPARGMRRREGMRGREDPWRAPQQPEHGQSRRNRRMVWPWRTLTACVGGECGAGAFQGGWRANASEPTRGLNARTTRDDAARKNVRCVVGLRASPAAPDALTQPSLMALPFCAKSGEPRQI